MIDRPAKLTIHTIAKMANVSPGTVSRVLSGKPGVGDETRARIQALIETLNYQPNVSAQRLGSRRSWSIGLVFTQSASRATAQPIFPEMMGAMSDFLAGENYTLTLFSQASHSTQTILQALFQGKVDGLILPDVRIGDETVSQLLVEGFPFVVIGQRYTNPKISWVDTDHDRTTARLTDLLIAKGHRRIAFINGSEEFSASSLRLRGFQTAMDQAGLPVPPQFLRQGEFSAQTGFQSTADLLEFPGERRPTAIVAASDLIAAGCLQAAVQRELCAPDDLAITGYDDNPIAQYTQPPLTTARAPIQEMGIAAARFILGLVNGSKGETAQQLILPSQLILRGSSG